jgi:hypothetical protein
MFDQHKNLSDRTANGGVDGASVKAMSILRRWMWRPGLLVPANHPIGVSDDDRSHDGIVPIGGETVALPGP